MSQPHLVHDAQRAQLVRRDRLIRLPEALRLAGVGKSTWYGLVTRHEAPSPVRITPRCVAWSENAVLEWVQARLAAAGGPSTLVARTDATSQGAPR